MSFAPLPEFAPSPEFAIDEEKRIIDIINNLLSVVNTPHKSPEYLKECKLLGKLCSLNKTTKNQCNQEGSRDVVAKCKYNLVLKPTEDFVHRTIDYAIRFNLFRDGVPEYYLVFDSIPEFHRNEVENDAAVRDNMLRNKSIASFEITSHNYSESIYKQIETQLMNGINDLINKEELYILHDTLGQFPVKLDRTEENGPIFRLDPERKQPPWKHRGQPVWKQIIGGTPL